ncbi:hypothetical protein PLANPX_5275 [Lacipirellula parvula]|uniref:Uncharacterized protein n=1 Tax=Lacipirellula parvula TaxID=2650471 RepID=A0A5K7XM63_9BACT|nr:hypothetical protein PLANPX_5275 [Lacipirellula parvula]
MRSTVKWFARFLKTPRATKRTIDHASVRGASFKQLRLQRRWQASVDLLRSKRFAAAVNLSPASNAADASAESTHYRASAGAAAIAISPKRVRRRAADQSIRSLPSGLP